MNRQKLHIKLIDKYENQIFEGFIHHIDAVPSNTICYFSEFTSNDNQVIRLIETINSIQVTSEGIKVIYESGAYLQISRRIA